jgi:hypothetical protein
MRLHVENSAYGGQGVNNIQHYALEIVEFVTASAASVVFY